MKRTSSLFLIILALLLVISMLACSSKTATAVAPSASGTSATQSALSISPKVTTWNLQSFTPLIDPNPILGSNLVVVLKKYVEWVKDMSGGRLIINILPPNAVVNPLDNLATVKSGALDAALTSPIYDSEKLGNITAIARGLPGLVTTIPQVSTYIRNPEILNLIREAYGAEGVYYTPFYWSNDFNFLTKFEINGIDDLKGKKIRALGADAAIITKCGASPVTLVNVADMYTFLRSGVIDGVLFGGSGALDLHLEEIVKYFVVSPSSFSMGGLIFNKSSLAALPDDIEINLMKYTDYMSDILTVEFLGHLDSLYSYYQEHGVKLIRFSDAEAARYRQFQDETINDMRASAQSGRDTYFLKAMQIYVDMGLYK